jgi:hypothetical protein
MKCKKNPVIECKDQNCTKCQYSDEAINIKATAEVMKGFDFMLDDGTFVGDDDKAKKD